MAIEDKGKTFGIFYTDDGIKCLNSDIGMEILGLVEYENMTLAELARKLKMPVSTVLFNTNKLEEKRLIASYRDSEDRRKVYYSNISLKLITSCEPHPEYDKLLEHIVETNTKTGIDLYRSLINFACINSIKTGIDISPMIERGGRLMGQLMVKRFNINNRTDANIILEKFLTEAGGPDLELVSDDPLAIGVHQSTDMPRNQSMSFLGTMGVICSIVENLTGRPYRIKLEKSNNPDMILLLIDPVPDRKIVPTNMIMENGLVRIKKNSGVAEIFCVSIDKHKYPRMINNPAQIKIIEALSKNPDTLKGLNKRLGGSQSTLFSNMTKLETGGIIYTDRSIPGSNVYKNYGIEAISRKKDLIKDYSEITDILMEAIVEPKYYYRSLFKYFMVILDATGIDSGPIQEAMGRSFAKVTLKRCPDITVDEFIDSVCMNESVFGTTFSRESYIPLTFYMENKLFIGTGGKSLISFYIGEISEIIYRLTKRTYVLTSVKDLSKGKGVSAFRFTLEPEIPMGRNLP